jgi:DNA invertase Pin-like site-specific DNA recombinase
MSEKIRPQHLARKAILYVRQSSPYQVIHNLESQKLQYAMEARLRQLGWHEIEVVDEDLGRSAAGSVTRAGFERMVAEVCLGMVGAVAAREVSRFARNSRDWQQLVEVCRVVDTVLIDQEMVYAPRLSNDHSLRQQRSRQVHLFMCVWTFCGRQEHQSLLTLPSWPK